MNKKQRTKFTKLLKRREIFVPFINSVCFFFIIHVYLNAIKFKSHLMMCWEKIVVLKAHLLNKIFCVLYRSFANTIKINAN